ncbi:MAG: hypothetical protein PHF84_05970 [bacterium]|nr:hypothetical protein [bacterium]
MKSSVTIVLYQCRDKLTSALKKNLINDSQTIDIIDDEKDLLRLCDANKYFIIVYDGKERKHIKGILPRILNKNVLLLFLLTGPESKKHNFKKNSEERVLFITMPPSLQELSQQFDIIYKARRLEVASKEYEEILKAYEQTGELSRNELMNIRESLAAWEKVGELSRKELIEYNKEREAYDSLIEFINNENMFKDKVLKAWEQAMEMGREELVKAYEEIKKYVHQREETQGGKPEGKSGTDTEPSR